VARVKPAITYSKPSGLTKARVVTPSKGIRSASRATSAPQAAQRQKESALTLAAPPACWASSRSMRLL